MWALSFPPTCISHLPLFVTLVFVFFCLFFTFYPPRPCLFASCTSSFLSLFSHFPPPILPPLTNLSSNLSWVPPPLSFPHFYLSVPFLPTCFIFYCTCFLSSSLVPVAPLFPSLSLFPSFPLLSREEERAWFARIVRSPAGGPGRPQGAMCFTFQFSYLFTSFHFLISVITVLCQPVINGPTEPRHCYHGYTVSACTRVCVHARTKKKGKMDGLAAPIMVDRSVLHRGATTGELLLV